MPSLTLTVADLAAIAAGKLPLAVTIAARARLAAPPTVPGAARLPAPGSKGHADCVAHEAHGFANVTPAYLCFLTPPTKAVLADRIRFAKHLDAIIAKRHAAHVARPIGDGKLATDPGQKRLSPLAFARWLETTDAGRKLAKTGQLATRIGPPRKGKRVPVIPASKLTSSRRRARKCVIRVAVRPDRVAA